MQSKNPITKIKKTSTGKIIWQYLMIVLGILAFTFAWSVFLIPTHIIAGGVTGVSSIIYFATGVPVGISNFAINTILLLIGIKVLGSKFGLNTFIGIALASVSFILWQQVIHIEKIIDATQFDPFMCAIIGAGICGIGAGTTFNNGGNTGGTDIIALMITKFKNISPGSVILYIDIFIIASAMLLPGMKIENIVYGYVVMFVFTYVLDLVIEGNKQSYQIMVFSNNTDLIADAIGNEVKRGVTIIDAHGWYTKKDQKILMVIARKQDKVEIMRIIKTVDPNAFISVAKTQGVFGKNFDTLRL